MPSQAGVFTTIEQKQTNDMKLETSASLGNYFPVAVCCKKKVPMQAINEMKPLKYHAFGG